MHQVAPYLWGMHLVRSAAVLAIAIALPLAGCGGSSKPKAVASPTPTPSATPTVSASPAAVYPLTGLPVTSPARAGRPALSVKIDNIGPALPQAGLNRADIVTDILVEGGLTRLMATFQSQDASSIGPIRSARPVDADLLHELGGGIFAYSGADPREIAPSKQHSGALLVSNDADQRWFHRDQSRAAPHNVFSSTGTLYKAATVLLRHALKAAPQLFEYSQTPPAGARAATSVRLPFSNISSAAWTWTGSQYVRTQNGSPDRLSDGSRVSTTNVVILSVAWRRTSIIDDAGNADPFVIVTGSGKAFVMRDGKLITGRWVRPSYRVPVRLLDASGHVIPLKPGRTWLELQPRPFVPHFA